MATQQWGGGVRYVEGTTLRPPRRSVSGRQSRPRPRPSTRRHRRGRQSEARNWSMPSAAGEPDAVMSRRYDITAP